MNAARASRGFTVIEAVVASAAMGVLLMASMSLVVLSARAGPEAAAQAEAIRDARSLRALSDDLAAAQAITTLSANEITFEVPDRTGDGAAEVIRYWWPRAGAGLFREVNSAGAAETTGPWTSLSFTGTWASRAVSATGVATLGATTQRIAAFGVPSNSRAEYVVAYTTPLALTIKPRLPAGATHWKPDTVVLIAKSIAGSATSLNMTLRLDALLLPFAQPSSATNSGVTAVKSGSEYRVTFTFSNAPEIAASQTATFDIRTSSLSGGVTLYGLDAGVGDSRQWLHTGVGATLTVETEKADASVEYLVSGWVRSPATSASSASRLTRVTLKGVGPTGTAMQYAASAIGEPELK